MLELSNNNRGIFGNIIGLGKTRVSWGMIVLGFVHLHMHEDILENLRGHYPQSINLRDTNAVCLS
jgi:hypothetical protein